MYLQGPQYWALSRDKEGHRTFTLRSLVVSEDTNIGPFQILSCPGLAAIGSPWATFSDSDPWAYCSPEVKVTPVVQKERDENWIVEQTFTTLPFGRCCTTPIEDPLAEPPKLSGTFIRYTEQARYDRTGKLLTNSSLEQLKGPAVEFDANRPSVCIEINVATLDLSTITPMIDGVNDSTMWGMPKRCVKLSNVPWTKKFKGICDAYFTLRYEFEVSMKKDKDGNYIGFDKQAVDKGTKVLRGQWVAGAWAQDLDAVATNPKDYVRWKDSHQEVTTTLLNGSGGPLTDSTNPVYVAIGAGAATKTIQKYDEFNFLSLGIPASLE